MLALLTLMLAAPPREPAPLPRRVPMTQIQAIRSLSAAEAAQARPVRITGVVTYLDVEHYKDLFVQDAVAGIYLMPSDRVSGLAVGDRVTVEGVTNAGEFAPCVVPKSIVRLARGSPMPAALPFTMAAEDARWLDGQYVQVWAVVASVRETATHTILGLYNSNGRANLSFPTPGMAKTLRPLINAALTVRAVCVPRFDPVERTIRNDYTNLYANHFPMISMSSPQPKASEAIDHILRFSPDPHPGARRVTVTGAVVAIASGGSPVYVQDATGGIAVLPDPPIAGLSVGQSVEASGLVAIEGRRLRMLQASVKVLGEARAIVPVPAELAALVQGRNHATLISTTGRIDEVAARDGATVITLVDGAARLDVYTTQPAPATGSRVRIVGVLGRLNPFGPTGGGSVLWTRTPDDLTVLETPAPLVPPHWWTSERILTSLFIPVALLLLAFVWVLTLRQQVRRQTAELRQKFEMQAELEEKLRTSQKLEAIGRLAGGIAHDFNNLLTVINGCGELLANDLPAGSQQRDLARDIRSAGERAASLVSQLLLFSRRQAVRLQPLDLRPTVREAERILRRVIGETIRVECTVADDTPVIRAESTLIHQILLNLAVNARDAMPVGGMLQINVGPHDGATRITVRDSGIGMDEPTRARIFEPFFTTKGIGEGTGLGLATVYGIVQTLEGEIRCRSTLGDGTTFEIDLPGLKTEDPAGADGSTSRPMTEGRGTIMVCEDDEAVRELTSRILESAGYRVLAAETPTDAAHLAQTYLGTIELLLTDLVMPEMNGRELADLIQPLRPQMKILFMSGYTDDEIVRQGIVAEEIKFIRKPFNAAVLTARINSALKELSGAEPSGLL